MTLWEYHRISAGRQAELDTALEAAGNDGWELVAITFAWGGVLAILKRPKAS